ncbi:MAG: alpha/beta hydrolase [Bacteroidia bacterium]|nr:alpha/beta hydrolase [Bacteroidia bacterium]
MKTQSRLIFILVIILIWNSDSMAQLPQEQPLWPGGISTNPVKYKQEKLTTNSPRKSSDSQLNRVFSCVSVPTYIIHKPEKGKANGVAFVICPGGGFRDVWFDREGNDLGIWLAQRGITSLVLKYRTFNTDAEGFRLSWNEYAPHVYADARQAIYILRSQAKELGIDENKIGIGGFSAGGMLSLMTALAMYEKELPSYVKFNQINTNPDFIGLFYPGLNPDMIALAKKKNAFPPVFIMNGGEDKTTPAANCIELYNVLTSKQVSVEMHIYARGGHGFDSGIERGNGMATWRDSFIAWLRDKGFISE